MSTSWQREVPARPLLSGGYDTCGRWRRRLAIPPPAGVRQKPVESAYRRRLRLQLAVAAVVVVAGAAAPVAAAAPAAAAAVGLWWRAASVGRSRSRLWRQPRSGPVCGGWRQPARCHSQPQARVMAGEPRA